LPFSATPFSFSFSATPFSQGLYLPFSFSFSFAIFSNSGFPRSENENGVAERQGL